MLSLILVFGAAWADPPACAVENTSAEVIAAVARGEEAFRSMSADDLEKASRDASLLLGCLGEGLTRADVAAFMRLQGYAAFVRKDRAAALSWFDAAKALVPSYSIPSSLVSDSHPLRGLYDGADGGDPPSTQPLPTPETGFLTVSGGRAEVAPVGRPWVLQQLDGRGRVVQTVLVGIDDPVPSLVEKSAPTVETGPEPEDSGGGIVVSVRAGSVVQTATGQGNVLGAVGPALTVRLAGPLHLDTAGVLGVTGGGGSVAVQPVIRAGLRAESSGSLRGYGGAAALLALGDEGIGPGAGVLGGIRSDLGSSALFEVDALVGWAMDGGSGGAWAMLSAGVGGRF